MRVGVPAEIKDNENRIAMVPGGAAQLIKAGHEVLVQTENRRWRGQRILQRGLRGRRRQAG
jgi:alanine dehydrogenase